MKKVLQKTTEQVIMQTEGDNLVVLNSKGNLLIVLNQTAQKLFELCNGQSSDEISAALFGLCANKDELVLEDVVSDCNDALSDMVKAGLIKEVEE